MAELSGALNPPMQTQNSVYIRASRDRIFDLAADVESWPEILPHYQSVTALSRDDAHGRKIVHMAAIRPDFPLPGANFPVTWTSVQVCERELGRITFKHLKGIATGMWVEWRLEDDPWGRGVNVSIRHDLRYPLKALNGFFAQQIVGTLFVSNIAGRTLATIKSIAESEEFRRRTEQEILH